MPKERSINPAQAQRKEDKRKAVAKSKKQVQAQRNEKLSKRNPERLQRQIDELKQLEKQGSLRPKDKDTLSQLERDLKGVKRAREALGDAAPKFKERGDARSEQQDRRAALNRGHLGKRRRDAVEAHDSGSDTDPDIRSIPMPRDTPPPIPRLAYKDPQVGPDGVRVPHTLPSKPAAPAPAKIVYSSAPQVRDLKKEAVRFMPSAVQAQKRKVKGEGRLLEPEELDALEQAGYTAAKKAAAADEEVQRRAEMAQRVASGSVPTADIDAETARFEREMASLHAALGDPPDTRNVQMEEVDDDGA